MPETIWGSAYYKDKYPLNFSKPLIFAGLAYVLNERNIQGGSTLSLMSSRMDSMSDIGSISSLTPSIINSPDITENEFKSTGTPKNSPNCSRSPSPMLEACQNIDQDQVTRCTIFLLLVLIKY